MPNQREIKRYSELHWWICYEKIKPKHFWLTKDDCRESEIATLDALTCHSGESDMAENDMTAMLGRGGLTYIKPEVATMFYVAEAMFWKLAGTGGVVKEVTDKDLSKNALEMMILLHGLSKP